MKSILAILFLASACLWAADPTLPPEAAKVVTETEAAVEKARLVFEAAKNKAEAEAAAKLEKIQVALTKKGDLDGALAVKAKVEELTKVEENVLGLKPKPGPAVAQVAGVWQAECPGYRGVWTLTPDGKAVQDSGLAGTWSVDGQVVTTNWDGGIVESFTLAKGLTNGSGKTHLNLALTVRRVGDAPSTTAR
jgi:hypothetical protein